MKKINVVLFLGVLAVLGGCSKADQDAEKAKATAAMHDSLSRPVCNSMHPCSKS